MITAAERRSVGLQDKGLRLVSKFGDFQWSSRLNIIHDFHVWNEFFFFFSLTGFVLYRLPLNAILFDQLVEHPDGRGASSLFVPVTRMHPTLSFLWDLFL